MKAIVVTPYYAPTIGGLENYARQLNNALAKQEGWEIVIVTSHKGWRQVRERIDGMRIYRLGTWLKLSNTPLNPFWPLYIRRIIKREKPDIILAHTPVPSLADATALAKGKVPFVVFSHAATLLKQGSPIFNMAARIYNLFGVRTFRRADRIFAVSDFVKQQLTPELQRKTVVVPNAVWQRDIVTRTQPSEAKFIFIGSLARSHAWKGLQQVIDALALYREQYGEAFELTVVGDGTMRSNYERQVRRLGIERQVRFVGSQIGDIKLGYLHEALAMIMYPVTENDAFPTVMLEAWAQSVPVVSARIGSIATLIHDGEDGYLCVPKQPRALADKLHQVVQLSPTSRAKVARAATARTKDHYTWEQQARLVNREAGKLL